MIADLVEGMVLRGTFDLPDPCTLVVRKRNDEFLGYDVTNGALRAAEPELRLGLRDGRIAVLAVPLPADAKAGDWLNSLSSAERKEVAVARGLFAYFPDALAMIAQHSVRSNEKHNPGQPVHWSREKSSDHEDCIGRHSLSVAIDPNSMDGDAPHIVCRAWRAVAALQLWIEANRSSAQPCGDDK